VPIQASSARCAAVIGVLALAGALIAGPAAAAKPKVRTVPKNGLVKIGQVRCTATEACVVKPRPKRIATKVAGKKVKARVVVPAFLGAGGKATVKLRFGNGALERLAGHSATFRARVLVRGSGRKSSRLFKVRLKRPAAPTKPSTGVPGGGNGGASGEAPRSEPVSGEPAPLPRPITAKTVANVSLKWYPRASWLNYVATGEGTVAGGGATGVESTASACPAQPGSNEGGGLSSGVSLPYEIDFTGGESWFDPATGTAAVNGIGTVAFRFKAHAINLTGSEPEIQINGASSQAVFRFSGSEGTPYPNQRVALISLDASGRPTQAGDTYTYDLMRGTLTPNGEKVFAGFYTAPGNNGFGCVSASFTLP
jgi:hypothetical protein